MVDLLCELGDRERAANTGLKLGLVYQSEFEFEVTQLTDKAFELQRQLQSGEIKPSEFAYRRPFAHPAGRRGREGGTIDRFCINLQEDEIISCLFAGLVEYVPETNIIPYVARSWKAL